MSFMTAAGNPQLNRHGELNHLLTIEGLPPGIGDTLASCRQRRRPPIWNPSPRSQKVCPRLGRES